LFQETDVPSFLVDDDRRYVDANARARTLLGLSLGELRQLRIDDLTPPYLWARLEAKWARLMSTGTLISQEVSRPEGSYPGVSYYAIANALPGRHLFAFAPRNMAEAPAFGESKPAPPRLLTPREVEVLDLAASGLKGPEIATELVLTSATVRTHFTNIYRKLDVGDRAAAVAKAMRLGLIS
jgi:DNA-binding CsgD family transcriptional regulator